MALIWVAGMLSVALMEMPGFGISSSVSSTRRSLPPDESGKGNAWLHGIPGRHSLPSPPPLHGIPGRHSLPSPPPMAGPPMMMPPDRDWDKLQQQKNIMASILTFLNKSDSQSSLDENSNTAEGARRVTIATSSLATGTRKKTEEKKTKIVSFGEKVSNSTDNRAVQFSLNEAKLRNNDSLQVTGANILVLVRLNQTTNSKSKPSQPRRLTIKVYNLNTTSGSNPTEDGKTNPIAYLNVSPRSTRWERVLLPTSVVQEALDSEDQVLRLRITCDTCRNGDEVVTMDDRRAAAVKAVTRRPITRSVPKRKERLPGIGRKPEGGADAGDQPCLIIHAKAKRKPNKQQPKHKNRCSTHQKKLLAC